MCLCHAQPYLTCVVKGRVENGPARHPLPGFSAVLLVIHPIPSRSVGGQPECNPGGGGAASAPPLWLRGPPSWVHTPPILPGRAIPHLCRDSLKTTHTLGVKPTIPYPYRVSATARHKLNRQRPMRIICRGFSAWFSLCHPAIRSPPVSTREHAWEFVLRFLLLVFSVDLEGEGEGQGIGCIGGPSDPGLDGVLGL